MLCQVKSEPGEWQAIEAQGLAPKASMAQGVYLDFHKGSAGKEVELSTPSCKQGCRLTHTIF